MPKRPIRGEQWALCDRCGRLYPLSQLGHQAGFRICRQRCWDVRDINFPARREEEIARILGAGANTEGVDERFVNDAFGLGGDW